MVFLFFSLWGAFWNRARGSQIYGLCHSTTEGRIISMLMIALAAALYSALNHSDKDAAIFFWCFATLMLWCVPAWEKYTSATMGVSIDMSKKAFPPVDWIMGVIWANPKAGAQLRLWGLISTALRMLLASPCMLGLAYLSGSHAYISAVIPAAIAIPYYAFTYMFPGDNKVTMYGELTGGAIINFAILKSIGG